MMYRMVGGPPLQVADHEVRFGGTFDGDELADPQLLALLLRSGQVVTLTDTYDDPDTAGGLDVLAVEGLSADDEPATPFEDGDGAVAPEGA